MRGSRSARRAASRKGASGAAAPQRRVPRRLWPASIRSSRPLYSLPQLLRLLAEHGPGHQAWRAEGAPLMIVKKILTASVWRYGGRRIVPAQAWQRLLEAVESRPDGAGGVVAVDPPFVGDSTDDVQSVVSGRIDHSPLVPGAAVVLDFDPGVVVWADGGPDGEGAAGEAGAAVQDFSHSPCSVVLGVRFRCLVPA